MSGYFTNSIFSEPSLDRDGSGADIFITKAGFGESLDCSDLKGAINSFKLNNVSVIKEGNRYGTNTNFNFIEDLHIDNIGNKYILGRFNESIGYGGNSMEVIPTNTNGHRALYIIKLGPNNEFLWSAKGDCKGIGNYNANHITVSNEKIVIGAYHNAHDVFIDSQGQEISFDSPTGTHLIALDLDGNYLSGKSLIRDDLNISTVKLIYHNNNYYFLSNVFGTGVKNIDNISFDLENNNFTESFIFKLNNDLEFVDYYRLDNSSSNIRIEDFSLDNNDNLYLSGSFEQTIFGNEPISDNAKFILKANKNKDFEWLRQFNTDSPLTIADFDEDQNLVLTTNFNGVFESYLNGSLDNAITDLNGTNAIIMKFDPLGEWLWDKLFTNTSQNEEDLIWLRDVKVNNSNQLFVSLVSKNDFTYDQINYESKDIFTSYLFLMDENAIPIQNKWIANEHSSANGFFIGNTLDNIIIKRNKLYLSGYFRDEILFDDGFVSDSKADSNVVSMLLEFDLNLSVESVFDISDDLWEIFKVEPVQLTVLPEVDMGTVEIGDRREKTEQGFITVNSSFGAIVENVSFPDSDRFELVSGLPYEILPNVPNDFEFAFTPDQIGLEESPIIIETDRGEFESSIFGNGFDSNVEQLINPIDFGEVKIQTQGRTLIEDVLRNNGISPYEIDVAEIIGPDKAQFNLNSISTNILPANDILNANITFAPNRLGRTSSILALVNESSSKTWHVDLYGEGIDLETARFNIYTENLEDDTGNRVLVPIYVDDVDELIRRRVDTIYTELSFNESLLYPYDENNLGEVYARRRTIPYKFDINKAEGNLLAEVPMLATLGDAQATDLDLNFSIPIDTTGSVVASVFFDETDGEFRLSDICWDGGARLLTSTGKYTIDIFPNPVKEEVLVTFGIIETSNVKLTIFSATGELIEEIYNEDLEYGFYEEEFELDLQNGSYILIIETISGRKSVNFQVVR
jgi:hypothetical protein